MDRAQLKPNTPTSSQPATLETLKFLGVAFMICDWPALRWQFRGGEVWMWTESHPKRQRMDRGIHTEIERYVRTGRAHVVET